MQGPKFRPGLPISRAAFCWLIATAVFLIAVIDSGSVVIIEASVPDDARDAGYAATAAIQGLPKTQQSVVMAYDAAAGQGANSTLLIDRRGFTVYPDGRVTLTATRIAPTLVFRHLPILRDLTVVKATTTVSPLPY